MHLHADAEDDVIKLEHIEAWRAAMEEHDDDGSAVLGGGDFNTLPPDSPRWADFPDDACAREGYVGADHLGEEDWLLPLYDRFTPAVARADFADRPDDFFTFSSREEIFWTRKLDFLFANRALTSGKVLQDERTGTPTLDLSDHAPLVVELELGQ